METIKASGLKTGDIIARVTDTDGYSYVGQWKITSFLKTDPASNVVYFMAIERDDASYVEGEPVEFSLLADSSVHLVTAEPEYTYDTISILDIREGDVFEFRDWAYRATRNATWASLGSTVRLHFVDWTGYNNVVHETVSPVEINVLKRSPKRSVRITNHDS